MRHYIRKSSRPGLLSLETIEDDGSILMVERYEVSGILGRLAQIETFARLVGAEAEIDGLDAIVEAQAAEQEAQMEALRDLMRAGA